MKLRRRVALLVLLAVSGGFFALAWVETRHNGANAHVGDCVKPKGEDSVSIVNCDSPNATLRVVGRLEHKTQTDAEIGACDSFDATQMFWTGEADKPGTVLCLAPNAR